ncbi:MAG TPA: 50S ribosomal protein L28 [Candidatus Magasanikbacteria bacterium]|nr:50S ribosomal protein L28 [Candidatus Magasanikbacteria bacterium]
MPKCDSCGKGAQKAANRSHSKVKTLRRQKPNLQKVEKQMICASCRRAKVKKMKKGTV